MSGSGGQASGALAAAAGAAAITAGALAASNSLLPAAPPGAASVKPDLLRFLTQATFGSTDSDALALAVAGIPGWMKAQRDAGPGPDGPATYWSSTPHFHLDWITRRAADFTAAYDAARQAAANDPAALAKIRKQRVTRAQFQESFWARALLGQDQLRHRMAFALSQIFVVSFSSTTISPRIAASWYDMLSQRAFGSYLDLLEAVTLHPAMGIYLNVIGNEQADNDPSRHPDENYAREIMQLMSIGQVQLKPDGTPVLDAAGAPVPTYSHDDIAGLAKVFTGWGWYAARPTAATFGRQPGDGSGLAAPDVQNLIAYPAFHSQLSKTFLGKTIPAYAGPAPTTAAGALALRDYQTKSLKTALSVIASHGNVPPFIARRLIQRFVTSNPSPAYVGRVAAVFSDPRQPAGYGDLFATLTAVLTDREARSASAADSATFGKLREPVIRMTNFLRASHAASKPTSSAPVGNFTPPADFNDPVQLAEAPLEALSVFNFWMPDYVPPGTGLARSGLAGPEFQAVDVLTVASYLNLMTSVIQNGGWPGGAVTVSYANDLDAITPSPITGPDNHAALVARIAAIYFSGAMSSELSSRLSRVLASISTSAKATPAQVQAARLAKVKSALLLALTSPEYIVQR